MVNAFTNLQIDFIFSIRNYSKKKKDIRNIFAENDKVVERKPVVGYDSLRISCIYEKF